MTLRKAIEKIEKCDFECEAGPLALNVGFIELKMLAQNCPKFLPGQIVEFEVTAQAHGEKFSRWVEGTITSCSIKASTSRREWRYVVQRQPPAEYFNGSESIILNECDLRERAVTTGGAA